MLSAFAALLCHCLLQGRKELLHQEHSQQQRWAATSAAGVQVPSGPGTVCIDPRIKVNVA